MRFCPSIFFILFCFTRNVLLAQLIVENDTNLHFDVSQVHVNEAGDNFQTELQTGSDELLVGVRFMPNTVENAMYRQWQLSIKKVDYDWPSQLNVWARRTGPGNNDYGHQLLHGETYQALDWEDQFFFSGTGHFDHIPIQFKISGISVTLPAKSYLTEIIITLWEE